jgi:hypothetical protein
MDRMNRIEGKGKKAKGKSLRKKSEMVSASLLPFSFCPLPFFHPVYPVYPCLNRLG